MKFHKHHNDEHSDQHGLVPLRHMMDRLFNESFLFPDFADSFFAEPLKNTAFGGIRVDVEETDKSFLVTAELPGADPDKIDLDIADNRLTLSAEMGDAKEEKDKHYLRRECSYGKIQRSFDFSRAPIDADKAKANFKNGVLTITLPKKGQLNENAKKIPINS